MGAGTGCWTSLCVQSDQAMIIRSCNNNSERLAMASRSFFNDRLFLLGMAVIVNPDVRMVNLKNLAIVNEVLFKYYKFCSTDDGFLFISYKSLEGL